MKNILKLFMICVMLIACTFLLFVGNSFAKEAWIEGYEFSCERHGESGAKIGTLAFDRHFAEIVSTVKEYSMREEPLTIEEFKETMLPVFDKIVDSSKKYSSEWMMQCFNRIPDGALELIESNFYSILEEKWDDLYMGYLDAHRNWIEGQTF